MNNVIRIELKIANNRIAELEMEKEQLAKSAVYTDQLEQTFIEGQLTELEGQKDFLYRLLQMSQMKNHAS
jgi:hypothetical protein